MYKANVSNILFKHSDLYYTKEEGNVNIKNTECLYFIYYILITSILYTHWYCDILTLCQSDK